MAGFVPELRTCFHHQRSTSSIPRRSFTSTTARRKHGPLPTFPATSSPELDNLLSTFRTNVFLPSHLLKTQQSLIYRKSRHHHLLGDDPVTVTVPTTTSAEAEFTLTPLNRFDEPGTKASFHTLLTLLKAKSDWTVLPGFLEGLRGSGRRVTPNMAEKLVRTAAAHGALGTIMESLRRVDRIGVRLDNRPLAREIMWGALQSAIVTGWSEEGIAKGLRQAESALTMMEDPRHASSMPVSPTDDPRKAPEVLSIPMLLVAMRALRFPEGRDDGGKMERYASQVVDNMAHGDVTVDDGNWWSANEALMVWSPVAQGIVAVSKALDGKSEWLRLRLEGWRTRELEPLLAKARSMLAELKPDQRKRRGEMMEDDLRTLRNLQDLQD